MAKPQLIWDLPVRIFHWGLVITLFCLWYTSDQERGLLDYHILFGYFTFGLIVFRVAWGFVGTRYAKFVNFIPSLQKMKQALYEARHNINKQYLGHNPFGSLMVLLLIFLVLCQAISGLFISDDIFTSGPYFDSVSESISKLFKRIHHNAFDFILIGSVIHVFAIFYYLLVKKNNLISPMIHGKKYHKGISDKDGIPHSKLVVAGVVLICVVIFVYWLVVMNVPVTEEYY